MTLPWYFNYSVNNINNWLLHKCEHVNIWPKTSTQSFSILIQSCEFKYVELNNWRSLRVCTRRVNSIRVAASYNKSYLMTLFSWTLILILVLQHANIHNMRPLRVIGTETFTFSCSSTGLILFQGHGGTGVHHSITGLWKEIRGPSGNSEIEILTVSHSWI